MTREIRLRFEAKIAREATGCWIWTGASNGQGYGRFSVDGRPVYAHRWAFENSHRSLLPHEVVDHLCRQPSCVNPDHLEAVTKGENTRRGLLGFGLDGTCRSGQHDMSDPANVYVRPSDGRRRCIPCRRAHAQVGAA